MKTAAGSGTHAVRNQFYANARVSPLLSLITDSLDSDRAPGLSLVLDERHQRRPRRVGNGFGGVGVPLR